MTRDDGLAFPDDRPAEARFVRASPPLLTVVAVPDALARWRAAELGTAVHHSSLSYLASPPVLVLTRLPIPHCWLPARSLSAARRMPASRSSCAPRERNSGILGERPARSGGPGKPVAWRRPDEVPAGPRLLYDIAACADRSPIGQACAYFAHVD